MAAQPDRFDVVVVGARGAGPQAVSVLASAIERRCGVPQAAFSLGLEHGGVEVHRDVGKAEAISLARVLQELGAVVDVRPAREEPSSPFLLEPDADAGPSPPAPPEFMPVDDDSDLISLHALDAEPVRPIRPARAPTGEVDTSRPQGAPARVESERPFDGGSKPPRRATGPGASTSARMHDSQRVPIVGRETPARGVATSGRSEAPRQAVGARAQPRSPVPPRTVPPRAEPPRAEPPPRAAPAAATRPTGSTRAVEGGRRTTTEVVSPAEHGPLDPSAAVIPSDAFGPTTTVPRFAPPETGARIELDLAAVGMAQAPVGATALSRGRGGSETSGARGLAVTSGARRIEELEHARRRSSTDLPAAGSGAGFPAPGLAASSQAAAFERHAPPPELGPAAEGLLARDRVTAGLAGAALACVVAMVVAYGWVRRDAIVTAERLEAELRAAVSDPIGVDDGRVRAPQTIADELASALDERRTRQLQIWVLIAVPMMLALALIKRDSVPGLRPVADPRR